MNARVSLIFAFIMALILAACGPSPAEQAATATQGAANIFATLTAQAPTPTPTFTPTPTSTATPTATATPTSTPTPIPTNTPKPSPTPTPGLSSLALTLDDLPAGFELLPAAQLRKMEEDYPRGSSAFGFQDDQGSQVVEGVLVPYTSRAEQAAFDAMLPQFVQLMAAAAGVEKNSRPLPGLDDIGNARAGITAAGKVFNLSMRWDIIAFRRNEVGVILLMVYPDGDKPAMPIGDLARLQDDHIQSYLAGGSAAGGPGGGDETIRIGLISPLTGQVPTFG